MESERIKAVEVRLDNHDKRLDAHGKQIDSLTLNDTRLEEKIDNVCREVTAVKAEIGEVKKDVAENTAMTHGIKTGVRQIFWLVSAATSVFALWQTVKQMGWF